MLRLTVPVRADVTILVDPARSGGAFTSGLMSLPPGAALPTHRLLGREELLFIYKGQGRATVDGRSMMVVPGVSIYVPRQAWQSLRNTGTGFLQFTWTASPPGLEQLFRALAQQSPASDPAALQAVLAQHGVELLPEGQGLPAAAPAPERHSRRRRHRGRGRGPGASPSPQPLSQSAAVAAPASSAPAAVPSGPAAAAGGGRRRRRRRGGRGHGSGAGQPSAAGATAVSQPSAQPGPKSAGPKKREGRGGRERHRRGHVKEVYMGGKWVRVVGEGPVIAQGSSPPPDDSTQDV